MCARMEMKCRSLAILSRVVACEQALVFGPGARAAKSRKRHASRDESFVNSLAR